MAGLRGFLPETLPLHLRWIGVGLVGSLLRGCGRFHRRRGQAMERICSSVAVDFVAVVVWRGARGLGGLLVNARVEWRTFTVVLVDVAALVATRLTKGTGPIEAGIPGRRRPRAFGHRGKVRLDSLLAVNRPRTVEAGLDARHRPGRFVLPLGGRQRLPRVNGGRDFAVGSGTLSIEGLLSLSGVPCRWWPPHFGLRPGQGEFRFQHLHQRVTFWSNNPSIPQILI